MVLNLEHMLDINRQLQKEDRGSTLFMVSADDLKEWAKFLIKETIELVESKYEPKFYTREELSNILHVSVQTIDNYCKKNILSPIRMAGTGKKAKVLFDQNEVRKAISNQTIGKYRAYISITQ